MKLKLVLFSWLILISVTAFAQRDSQAIDKLNEAIRRKGEYTWQKEVRITSLKKIKPSSRFTLENYHINEALYQEYQKYKIDSAVFYADENIRIAQALHRNDLVFNARLGLANSYSSLGKFLESEAILKSINSKLLNEPQLISFYSAQIQFYEHYTTNNYSKAHIRRIEDYRDSLLHLLKPGSVQYQIQQAQKEIGHRQFQSVQTRLQHVLTTLKGSPADYAMVTYLLGYNHQLQGNKKDAITCYVLSAATDVQNAIKDHASLQNLALIFYEAGDIEQAYNYTRSAIEDAIFCNVKFRTLRMSELYTIINTTYLNKEADQKDRLKLYLLFISILSAFLTAAIIYVCKQMKNVSRIKEELAINSRKMAQLNQEINNTNQYLNEINGQLTEANQVKEIYIAQFFNLCSTYINKLEEYRKTLNRKATEKHFEELIKMLRSTGMVKNEAEELYRIFDNIFLGLYPNFIEEFNALLVRDEQVIVKPGELLNTELRIYALIRLGITDSVKIAAFLRYSLSTIYNYRTNARNKSAVPRDEFEKMVSKIGAAPAENI